MKNTIKAKVGYRVTIGTLRDDGRKVRILRDGDTPIMLAEMASISDFEHNKENNECFHFCETFTTVDNRQYIYWRDEETDTDYLTKIKR